jgi:hypothetical protein
MANTMNEKDYPLPSEHVELAHDGAIHASKAIALGIASNTDDYMVSHPSSLRPSSLHRL